MGDHLTCRITYIQVNMVFCIYSTQHCIVTRHYIAEKPVTEHKGKAVPVWAIKERMEKGTALPICNLCARWMWVISFMPQPLHSQFPQHRRLGAYPDEEYVLRSSKTPMNVSVQDFNPPILIPFVHSMTVSSQSRETMRLACQLPPLPCYCTFAKSSSVFHWVKSNTFMVYRIRASFNNLILFMLAKSVQLALKIKLHNLWGSDVFITGISQVLET